MSSAAPRTKLMTVAKVTGPVNQLGQPGWSALGGLAPGALAGRLGGRLAGRPARGEPPPAVVTGQLVGPRGFGATARAGHHRGVDRRLRRTADRLRVAQVGPVQAVAEPPGEEGAAERVPGPTVSTTGAA